MMVMDELEKVTTEEGDATGRRISEPLDFEAIAKATGARPHEVDGGEGALLIAEHFVRVDREVKSPVIVRRLVTRMKEHCDGVAEVAMVDKEQTVFYCQDRKKFFAYQFPR
jgi:hypothetical protein